MPSAELAIIGAGPRGVCVLERISANATRLASDLVVHLIDPYPPGAGRVWRYEQSPLLRMNSMAEDVTMFTDESVRCEGPIVPGPSMAQWADLVRPAEPPAGTDESEVDTELRTLTGRGFATRRLASRY